MQSALYSYMSLQLGSYYLERQKGSREILWHSFVVDWKIWNDNCKIPTYNIMKSLPWLLPNLFATKICPILWGLEFSIHLVDDFKVQHLALYYVLFGQFIFLYCSVSDWCIFLIIYVLTSARHFLIFIAAVVDTLWLGWLPNFS